MPSKKSNKGRSRGQRLWHKTNWREIFERELISPKTRPPASEDEDEAQEVDQKCPSLEPLTPVKRAKSESDQTFDQPEPRSRVYLLSDLASLVSEAQPGSFVILDVDETIIMTRSSPSLLLTKNGVDAFRAFVHKRVTDWRVKNDHCQHLQKALKDKVPVTSTTAATIEALQGNGVFVCGLTARYSEFAKVTEKELESVGVNLGLESPFPAFFEDKELQVTVQNGVIYCNNQDKGLILKGILERNVFRDLLRSVRTLAAAMEAADAMLIENQQSQVLREVLGCTIPNEIFFVDDMYPNAASVCEHMSCLAEELGIVVSSYHYVPQELAEVQSVVQFPSEGENKDSLAQRILARQVETFFEKQLVLSNEQARKLVET